MSFILCTLAFLSLTGCNTVASKELVIANDSSSTNSITGVGIQQYVGTKGQIIFDNILDDNETIAPGESKSFFIAPYTSSEGTTVMIEYGTDLSPSREYIHFTYDYKVDSVNQAITVTFDGSVLSVSGSNAEKVDV